MTKKLYKNKYRIDSARLPGYDYSQDGLYFVTICTNNREMYFSDVITKKIILNDIGNTVADEWNKTEIIRPNVFLDEWIIMPNHIHGILKIYNGDIPTDDGISTAVGKPTHGGVETPWQGVSTTDAANATDVANTTIAATAMGGNKPEWKPGVLGAIINQFKRQCTINIRKNINPEFAWQPRYYDHIIRNERTLNKIRQYIIDNPAKWHSDRNNRENLWM